MALDLSQPTDLVNQAIPPQDGIELEQRKSGWRAYLQQLNNPNTRAALMQTGLGMMRSPGYGQNGWDTAANALQGGVQTLERLRERDRVLAQEAQDRAIKENQRTVENKRGERQVAATERNAATNERSTEASITQGANANNRAGFQLEESIRHNQANEANDRIRAEAEKEKSGKYNTSSGRTPAEIEKLNRLKKYYMDKEGLDELTADKKALDYLATAKGKSPRQLVIDRFRDKVKAWQDNQYDPSATLTPQQAKQMQDEAVAEVKMAEEAGRDITDTRGIIVRPTEIAPTPGSPAAVQDPAMTGLNPDEQAWAQRPAVPDTGMRDPMTERMINIWIKGGGSPQQINELLKKRGVDPKVYGY